MEECENASEDREFSEFECRRDVRDGDPEIGSCEREVRAEDKVQIAPVVRYNGDG
jgi:hypothetical protein